MPWLRGTVTSPQKNRALIIRDGEDGAAGTPYQARYMNCEPAAESWDRLRQGEKVLFRVSYVGNNKDAASEVLRIEEMSLEDLAPHLGYLLAADDLLHGEEGDYRLERQLGHGAAGQVWLAKSSRSNAPVAIKAFSPSVRLIELKKVANVANRFMREARAGVSLQHLNIVDYKDLGNHNGVPFICLELCNGTASDELEARGQLTLERSVEIVRSVLDGLEFLHARRIVHRDVKPANILIRENGGVCLGDLGIIRIEDGTDVLSSMRALTGDATHLGSWFYMAPEQRLNPTRVGPPSDIYSSGVSWYEMLSGDGVPMPERIAAKDLPFPLSHPHPINQLIMSMLAYAPEDRPTVAQARRCLRFASDDYSSEVEYLVRDMLVQTQAPEVEIQTMARSYRVLELFDYPEAVLVEYLHRGGYDSLPPITDDESGEESTSESEGYLFELADWVARNLVDGERES